MRLALALTILALAGCAAATYSLAPAAHGAATKPAAAEETPPPNCGNYGACSVDACFGTLCIAFDTQGTVQAELRGLTYAQGIAADGKGNAYIADSGAGQIFEYGPYLTPLLKTYDDPNQVPLDVAVAVKRKLLAVSNKSTSSSGDGSVSVYANGKTKPTATLTDSGLKYAQGIGIAIDRSGDCFWSATSPSSGISKIDEFFACAGSPTTIVTGKSAIRGLTFDRHGNLYYIVDVSASDHDIYKCKGTKHCRTFARNFAKPMMLAFDNRWHFLWTDDAGVLEGPEIESISKGGRVRSSFRAGSSTDPPFGIAHVPGPSY